MISMPAIEPAISIRPVMNQLIPNVSSVPSVRQLTALATDRMCVSAPRNKTTGHLLPGSTGQFTTPAFRCVGRSVMQECENHPPIDRKVASLRAFCSKKPDKLFDQIEY
jgi:hypothetical protein